MEHLPLWFLIVSLVVPRISLLIAYLIHKLDTYSLHGWVPPTIGVLIPRVLVMILIFQDRGWSGWLLVHGLFAAAVYSATGRSRSHRSRK